ncbi:MAG: hypothetical protein KKG75_01280 [Nanoarchaeota archaeon]|nr:hypothetical protein [Nanoarchaeota archaeon]
MFKHQTLHKRKIIKKLSSKEKYDFSEKELLKKARRLYNDMIKKDIVKETAKKIGYISCRMDLTGVPEISFSIVIENGKIQFVSGKNDDTDMAIGMSKKFFVDLVNNPPKYGNMKIVLFNNISLRRGNIKLFQSMKPLLVNALLSKE